MVGFVSGGNGRLLARCMCVLICVLVVAGSGCGDAGPGTPPDGASTRDAATETATAVATETASETVADEPVLGPEKVVAMRCDSTKVELFEYTTAGGATPVAEVDVEGALTAAGIETTAIEPGFCALRPAWNADFTKVLVAFDLADEAEDYHIGVIDVTTSKATDLTAARAGGDAFGTRVLDERSPFFQYIPGPDGAYELSDDKVIFASEQGQDELPVDMTTSLSDPENAEKVTDKTVLQEIFLHPIDFAGDCIAPSCTGPIVSLDGKWVITQGDLSSPSDDEPPVLGRREDLGGEGVWEIVRNRTPVRCARGSLVLSWIDKTRFVIWDGAKQLRIVTVNGEGTPACGSNLMPDNDYTFGTKVLVDPDGSRVYFGDVRDAPETSYAIPLDGGEPEAMPFPELEEGITVFPRGPLP